ncbi:hypothetical protein PV402_39920 [Streptomyces scabiei]|uniref:hypothetical protein n=1 Tax=Streptomyces scabiei TaxID=1930 RepID=UPI0029BDCB5A|nr:hypothetical protein [Streptomyces scabiei]MDX2658356.1 hypothetical protein [Streptomyces scabiei]MDX2870512.1 hypothetical protein [Streptomyces scabiei]
MTLSPIPIATTGGEHTAQQFRMMIKDLARDQQGVTTGLDLKVTALATPGAGVQVSDGSAVIAGKVSTVQGHYSAYNIGSDTVAISATGGTGRSDMLVLRVEDPDYEGTRDPETDPIVFFEVVSNVSSSATTAPSGYSAIPLARIDIPASTATITNAMIVDLRKVANPRRERLLETYYASDPLVEISGTSETWKTHPNLTMKTLAIPAWAKSAKVVFTAAGIRLVDGNVFGGFRFMLGTEEAAQWVNIDDNQGSPARRIHALTMAETIDLTTTTGAAMRGTNQAFKARMRTRTTNAGKIGVDGATSFIIDVEFQEGAI